MASRLAVGLVDVECRSVEEVDSVSGYEVVVVAPSVTRRGSPRPRISSAVLYPNDPSGPGQPPATLPRSRGTRSRILMAGEGLRMMAHDEIQPITEVTAAPVTLQHKLCALSSSSDSTRAPRPPVSNSGPAAVALPTSGSGRRRVVAVAVVLAVVTAVVIAAQPGRPPPVTVPPVPEPTQP